MFCGHRTKYIHYLNEVYNKVMADTKMLQAILDRVSSVDRRVISLEQKVDEGFKAVDKRFDETNKRVDKLGMQLARLEDDALTIEEFDGLEKRVSKLEKKSPSN